jgi:hypothetical protein
MKKLLFTGIVASLFFGESQAANEGKKSFRIMPEKRLQTKAELQKLYAEKEAKLVGRNVVEKPATFSNKRSGNGGNQVQTNALSFSDLGQSINPFTSVTAGRNYVAADAALNTVALIRRGGPTDVLPTPLTAPGNKLFVDVSTRGGSEGSWRLGRGGVLFNNQLYDISVNNHGPRYPQGMIYRNPSAPTDTNQAFAFALTRVLDGTNDAWGGLGTAYRKLAPGSATTQNLWSSMVDPVPVFHFRQYGLDQTSNGAIFTIEQEEDLSSGEVVFTDKIMIYKYTYNSTSMKFDSTVTFLQFVNSGQTPATAVGDAQIAFGPDGQVGYVAIAAFNPDFNPAYAYTTYLAKTMDGGNTWSNLQLVNLNRTPAELEVSTPAKNAFRQAMLGDYVQFTDTTLNSTDTNAGPGIHPVDYTIMDMDLTVDANNYAHIFGTVCVAGFGDTLQVTGPGYYRPGYGSWNIHLTVPPNSIDSTRALVVNQNVTLQGCWGDCDTDENINEFNRPHISRSENGNVIVMSWYDTDTSAHPQTRAENNSNPDLWYRAIRVTGPGTYNITSQSRNLTKGSDYDGLAILGSVAPRMLNTANGHALASTIALLSDFDATNGTALWPITHLYAGGANIPSAVDSFPLPYNLVGKGNLLLDNDKLIAKNTFSIYPNPGKGMITARFALDKSGLTQIRVFNHMGQLVENSSKNLSAGNLNMALDLRHLKSGIYFLNIQQGKTSMTQRFVVE